MVKRIIVVVLSLFILFFVIINVTNFIYPLNLINKKSAIQVCESLDIMENNNDNHYVTRIEFLEALLRTIGMTDEILESCASTLYESPMVSEVFDSERYSYIFSQQELEKIDKCDTTQIPSWAREKVTKYEWICRMAMNNKCLQVYLVNDDKLIYGYEYRGTNIITINEAISMIQACLIDVDNDFGMIDKKSSEYRNLCTKAHFNGILLPCDASYWSLTESKLKTQDMAVLLKRLLCKKRYKYIAEPIFGARDSWEVDSEHSMTYYEYLQNR